MARTEGANRVHTGAGLSAIREGIWAASRKDNDSFFQKLSTTPTPIPCTVCGWPRLQYACHAFIYAAMPTSKLSLMTVQTKGQVQKNDAI
eukprot:scaffold216153_cov32-Prasinocladus_malaysianus.AAC.2